jgi:hypothetical protein
MARPHPLTLGALLASLLAPLGAAAQAPPEQRPPAPAAPLYLAAMERELRALELDPLCRAESAARARCEVTVRAPGGTEEFELRVVYSDDTDTVYAYVPGLAQAAPEARTTASVLRRLAELNWELLLAKLEWNATSGEVRLSAVLSTDSNFDRAAFRAMIRNLSRLADRLRPELRRVAGG